MFIPIILWVMADGIAISGRCLNHFELMLTLGRCYCLILADVIANIAIILTDVNVAIEADVIALY